METKTLIKANAKVMTIVTLSENDVYLRLHEDNSYNESQLKYGVVTNVLHNGTDAVITAIEYWRPSYGGAINADIKVFKGNDDLKLFRADPVTFLTHLNELEDSLDQEIKSQEDALEKKKALAARVRALNDLPIVAALAIESTVAQLSG